ncbi:hypothetical protein [Halobaculum sp. MBLA0143]|uniref:hypothetical protein n=1 Tax=Halobaculum sp. MBLA0143 TaxID=3079933 RepID=UPI003526A9CB
MSWAENYLGFLAGTNSPTLLLLTAQLRIPLAVAFVHAVWNRNLTLVTLSGFLATAESGVAAYLPPSLTPLAKPLCPVCTVSSFGIEFPVWVLIVAAALLCNSAELLTREEDTRPVDNKHHGTDGVTDIPLITTKQHAGRLLANLSGYTLVVSFLGIATVSSPIVGAFPNVSGMAAVGLAICALVFYEFVATNAAFGLAAITAVVWHAGLAALQYDTAMSEFLLSTATLLTISTTGLLYAKWRGRVQRHRSTPQP